MNLTSTRSFHFILFWYFDIDIDRKIHWLIYFIISTIHFSILYYYLYNTTHIYIHAYAHTHVHIHTFFLVCTHSFAFAYTHVKHTHNIILSRCCCCCLFYCRFYWDDDPIHDDHCKFTFTTSLHSWTYDSGIAYSMIFMYFWFDLIWLDEMGFVYLMLDKFGYDIIKSC